MRETLITAEGRRRDSRTRVDATHVVDGYRSRSRDRRARLSADPAPAAPVSPVAAVIDRCEPLAS